MVGLWSLAACAAAGVASPAAELGPDDCTGGKRGKPRLREEEQVLAGRVVRIVDGDTLVLLDRTQTQRRIRLAGIDTPERRQPFYRRATQHLADLVHGKDVEVRWRKIDPYNRCVGKVLVADPACAEAACPLLDANLAQIEAGYAWWYRRYAREQPPEDRTSYEAAEARAREAGLGLWGHPDVRPPWEDRSKKRSRPRSKKQGAAEVAP